MKKQLVGLACTLLLTAMGLQTAFAENNGDNRGEYASAMKSSAAIPPGHFALMAQYANRYLSANGGKGGNRTIFAETLMDGIDDPKIADELSDYFILDIRSDDAYKKGHIPGAVFVPFGEVAKPENLALLPTDKPILVVCFTGHTASVATGILDMLGYNAWTLRFGMVSWVPSTPTKVWSLNSSQAITGGSYSVATGGANA